MQSQKQEINFFNAEWENGVVRFSVLAGLKSLEINLKHPLTRLPTKPNKAIPKVFKQWQQTQSPQDRQFLFFAAIYKIIGHQMKPWQIANIMNASCQPGNALELLRETMHSPLEPEDYLQTCASLAKTLFNLNYYEDALNWISEAYSIDQNNYRFQTIFADCLFMNDNCQDATEIYKSLIATAEKSESDSITKTFTDFFSHETGVVPSPVWAVELANQLADPQQVSEFWQLGELEFYDSPYFRANYAYYLADIGELQRSFAKLITLVKTMPWLKEASLNLIRYFEHFDPSGDKIMPEFQAKLRQQIKDKNWTSAGMKERVAVH